MEVLLLIYNLLLQTLYCIPVVYAWILYQHTRKRLYLYLTGLFFFYFIENIIIFITEFDSEFAYFYDTTFMSVPTIRTIIFTAVLFFILQITTSILKESTNYILLSLLGLIVLFMLFVPMMKDSAMKVFIYYTPCQVFSFLIGIYGMKRLKMHSEKYGDTLRRQFHRVFLWTAIFSVLIIVEDVIVIFNFDNYGVTGIHITNRSFSENLMSIYFVYTALRILVPYLRSLMVSEEAAASAGNTGVQAISAERETPLDSDSESQTAFLDDVLGGSLDGVADAEQDAEDQEVPRGAAFRSPDGTAVPAAETGASSDQADYSKFYLFSRDYQLTPREQHILQLLLENKTNVEIADDLCISIGTAKAHVHNIFAKVEVKKRQQLLDIYGHYNPTDTV